MKSEDRLELLIGIISDKSASITERDDAASDLADFCSDRAIRALALVGQDKKEDETVLNTCGESLGVIWTTKHFFDKNIFQTLSSTARHGAYFVIKSRKPDWINEYELDKDHFSD